jgi:sporulation protein YlmC with PRC-barrel domain
MTSEQIIRRSDILNTQVITRDNGKRLGIVSQVWVDIDQREVVALGLRDSLISISGLPRYMYLNTINQIGDVVLVDNEDVIEDVEIEALSNLINWEVITETGEVLGKVRGFKFNGETGKIYSIVIASLGLPQIPDQFLSTYELSIDEIVSTGPNRLIVFEGAEERVNQLTVGVLERLGIGKAPWERDTEEEYGYSAPRQVAPANHPSQKFVSLNP